MALSLSQLKGILRTAYIRVYEENIPAPSFLRSFFRMATYDTATVQIEVSRGNEQMAVDVVRGVRGNRNTFDRWSAKEYMPPYFKEFFDATQLDHYDRVLGQMADASATRQAGVLARSIARKYLELRKKIERAKELQCAQVFETGVITLNNGDNIDYKRKSDSLVDLGTYWDSSSTDVETQLKTGCDFVRQKGKNGSKIFNLIMSETAWIALKKIDFFKNNANYRNVDLNDIRTPQGEAFSGSWHGRITAGGYTLNVWTYDETYETIVSGVKTTNYYWPSNKAFIVPERGYDFEMAHGAVPSVMKMNGREFVGMVSGEYVQYDNVDKNNLAHYYYLMSAPVAIPITVDQIYTMQVLGSGGGQG